MHLRPMIRHELTLLQSWQVQERQACLLPACRERDDHAGALSPDQPHYGKKILVAPSTVFACRNDVSILFEQVGKKKTNDVQFYAEVMDTVQTLDAGRRSM